MKKIKYGNRDKIKDKRNTYLQQLKDDQDDVYGAVLDTFNNDYLSYISRLVKVSKMPTKMRTQQCIQSLFQKKQKEIVRSFQQTPLNIIKNRKSKQLSPKFDQDYKNAIVPLKNLRELGYINQTGYTQKNKEKSVSSVFEKNILKNVSHNGRKVNKKIKQHYNRFPTKQAENTINLSDLTGYSEVSDRNLTIKQDHIQENKQFLIKIDQYLVNLQKNKYPKKPKQQNYSIKTNYHQDINKLEQLYKQNIKLRKKIIQIEQKIIQIEQNIQNHFIYCKKQEKVQKIKINDLTKALLRAISIVNLQKQEISDMKGQLRNFGRKAQFCVDKYERDNPDDQQQINQPLLKVMRPSRAISQYKIKKKKADLRKYEFLDKD